MRRTQPAAELRRHYLGPHPIIRYYLERMNWRRILRGCLGAGLRQGLDHAEVLGVLVHNVLVSRGPMYVRPRRAPSSHLRSLRAS